MSLRHGEIWKERHFVLVDGMLLVFKHQGGPKKLRIPLYDLTLEPILDSLEDGRYGFRLQASDSNTKYLISTTDEIEMQLWCNSILKQKILIEEAINKIMF